MSKFTLDVCPQCGKIDPCEHFPAKKQRTEYAVTLSYFTSVLAEDAESAKKKADELAEIVSSDTNIKLVATHVAKI
jgi:hypothetical protein